MKNEVTKRDPLENFEAQFKKATLPLMILSILSEREMYAYEIVQVVLERSQGKYKMPLLYNILTKLKEQNQDLLRHNRRGERISEKTESVVQRTYRCGQRYRLQGRMKKGS